jgi:hypothetical protein
LLEILPDAIDGIALEADPATAADIATDLDLEATAASLAVALAIAPGVSGASASGAADLAIVSVVQLRPGVFDDAFFRAWRDTYDEGACEVAGGVSGHAESEIGGLTTYIGSCAGGAHTYHVHIAGRDVLVSITAAGERRLGELVVAGLTE